MGRDIKTVNYFFYCWIVGLTILFGSALFLEIKEEFDNINDYAIIEGKASYNKDLLYRRWASMHGGVYVPITDETPPNPVLSHIPDRDITSENGVKLTLVNPAYMTRQVHEIAGGEYGVKGHITSLTPIREENKPDEWETKALHLFETGESEFSSIEEIDGIKHMRYMHSMTVEQSCLKCHAVQGYQVGDVRGGISVSVPMDTYNELAAFHIKNQAATYLFVYAVVLLLTGFGFKRLKKEILNRNLLQTKIIEREALLSRSQEMAHVGSWELDLTANKLTWSDETYRIFGCQPQECAATYEAFLGFIHPDDRTAVEEAYSGSVREGNNSYEIEHRIVRQETGEIRHVYERCVHVRDDTGAIIKSIGMVQDITEDKQAEITLKNEKDRIRTILDLIGDPIFVKDNQHRITIANQAFYEMFDMDEKSVIGNTLVEAVTEEERNHFLRVDRSVLDTGVPDLRQEELTTKNKTKTIITRKVRFIDDSGDMFLVGSIHDITERKKTEEQLFKSKEKAEEGEARYRTLFENMNTGFVLFEVVENEQGIPIDLIILAANEGFEKTTGLNLKDAVGMNLTKVLPGIEKDEADWIGTYSKVAHTGESTQFEQGSELLGYYYSISAFYAGPKQCAVTFQDITESKQAQELLQEREFLLSSSQRAAHIGTWSWKIGDTKVYWSDETYRIYGLNPAMGAPSFEFFFEIIHSEDRPKMQEWPTLLLAGLHPPPIEFRVKRSDGMYRVIQTDGDVIETVDGVPTRIAGTAYDITERKQAEEKLRESEYRYRKIYEDGATGMVMIGKDFKFLTANRSFCQMVGYQEEELQQLTFLDITHPDDKAKDIPQDKKLIAGEIDVYRTEKRVLNKNGQTIWVQLTVSPINDSNGQFLYFVGIIVNVTERKNAELDLLRMSRIMKNSQEIAHLGSFEYVAANQTTIWSEEEYRIYGLDPNGPSPEYNVMLEKCIHPDDAKLLHNTFMAAMQNQGIYELEHRIVRPDGSVRWVYDKAHPYFDEHGNLLRYVGATLDITERKHLLEELEKLNTELELKVEQRTALLEASNKELEAFSYSVSHDLRAPLRHINGYVDLLNRRYRDELPDKARHYLETVSGASRQMGTLIDELLQYSRTGRQEMVKKELDMNLLIKEVFEEVKSDAKGREINWEMQKLPNVYGDNVLLKQVWANLLGNAVKYTRNQQTAKISVSCREETKSFVFCIADNGVGFDMKYAHKLFGVFQRLHSQAEFEGTGIGLANVQRIVHKHLGRVWVEAQPGKGAKFYFSLPKYQEEKS